MIRLKNLFLLRYFEAICPPSWLGKRPECQNSKRRERDEYGCQTRIFSRKIGVEEENDEVSAREGWI